MAGKEGIKCVGVTFDLGLRVLQHIVRCNIGDRPDGLVGLYIAFGQSLDRNIAIKGAHVFDASPHQPS